MSFFLNLPIGKKLFATFSLMALVVLGLGLFSIKQLDLDEESDHSGVSRSIHPFFARISSPPSHTHQQASFLIFRTWRTHN